MKNLSTFLLLSFLSSPVLAAQELTKKYIDFRDQFIAQFEKTTENDDMADRKALKELEAMLQKMIGPIKPNSFNKDGSINLSTLQKEMGFGQVDGIKYASPKETLVVTTVPLLNKYLGMNQKPSGDVSGLSKSDDFYSKVFDFGSAITVYSDIPMEASKEWSDVRASLALSHQDIGPFMPKEIIVYAVKGDRVFIARSEVKNRLEQIQNCRSEWDGFKKKSDGLEKVEAGQKLEEDGFSAYKKCYGDEIKKHKSFEGVKKEAQELLEKIKNL